MMLLDEKLVVLELLMHAFILFVLADEAAGVRVTLTAAYLRVVPAMRVACVMFEVFLQRPGAD